MYTVVYAQREDDRPSFLRRVGHAAAIGAAALGGTYLGARQLPNFFNRGRLLQKGERVAGKLLSRETSKMTPLELAEWFSPEKHFFPGIRIQKQLRKSAAQGKVGGRVGSWLNERLALPAQHHFGVGLPGGKVFEQNLGNWGPVSRRKFVMGKPVRVQGEIPVRTPQDRAAIERRMRELGRDKKFSIWSNNCEQQARCLVGQGRKSLQLRALFGGGGAGAVLGGGGALATLGGPGPARRRERRA